MNPGVVKPGASNGVAAVNYGRSFGPLGSELVEVVADGESTLYLGFNHDRRPEIGVWQHAIARTKFDELVRRLHASGYDRMEPPMLPGPGAALPSIGERGVGESGPSLREFMPGQPELVEVLGFLSEIMEELRQHPLRVLLGEARWQSGAPEAGRVAIDLVLQNAGREALVLSNPLAAGKSGGTLRLVLLGPKGDQRASVAVDAGAIRAREAVGTAPSLTLAPGQSVGFELRPALPTRIGNEVARLTVISVSEDADSEGLEGTLELDLGPVKRP